MASLVIWRLVTDSTLGSAMHTIMSQDILVHDFEASGLDPGTECVVSCQVGVPATGEVFYFPLRHARGTNLTNPDDVLRKVWQACLGCPEMVGKNWSFDIRFALAEGLPAPSKWLEVEAAAKFYNANEPWLELETLARKYVNPEAGIEEKVLIEKILADVPWVKPKKAKGYLWYMPPEDVLPYGCADVRDTWALYEFYRQARSGTEEAAYRSYCEFLSALLRVELLGMQFDLIELTGRDGQCLTHMTRLAESIDSKVPRGLAVSSSQAVSKAFGLRHADDLHLSQSMEKDKALASDVLAWRRYAKASQTYFTPLLKIAEEQGVSDRGTLYPRFRPFGVVSSRLATRGYPVLGCTKGRDDCTDVRPCFVARPGCMLVSNDLAGAEVRILTHYSKCKGLHKSFVSGGDVYQDVADATGLTRKVAKALVLARFYGASVGRLSDASGLSIADAFRAVKALDSKYPEIPAFSKEIVQRAQRIGYIETHNGRRFHFDGEASPFKDAANRLAQSTVAVMIQDAMTAIHRDVPWARLWLQVHDEIIAEVPEGRVPEYVAYTEALLSRQPWATVPFVSESTIGTRWDQL